jgi:hypothetical protein
VFVIGVIWFAAASALCAAAVDVQMLIAARALEGIGGALLVASAALVACGAVLSFFTIRDDVLRAAPAAAKAPMHDQLRGRRATPRARTRTRLRRPVNARRARGGLTPGGRRFSAGARPEAAATQASTARAQGRTADIVGRRVSATGPPPFDLRCRTRRRVVPPSQVLRFTERPPI